VTAAPAPDTLVLADDGIIDLSGITPLERARMRQEQKAAVA
jgi:hypothetical protein